MNPEVQTLHPDRPPQATKQRCRSDEDKNLNARYSDFESQALSQHCLNTDLEEPELWGVATESVLAAPELSPQHLSLEMRILDLAD